ncbi:hypothetical protein, partial [Pedobacter sp.]|uniref:hypothetical protein n=1 Tax=Pedobacter sp. TaxID=1411316 RepID=UPI002BDF4E19
MGRLESKAVFALAATKAVQVWAKFPAFNVDDFHIEADDLNLTDKATARFYRAFGEICHFLRVEGSVHRLRGREEWSEGHLVLESESGKVTLLFVILNNDVKF